MRLKRYRSSNQNSRPFSFWDPGLNAARNQVLAGFENPKRSRVPLGNFGKGMRRLLALALALNMPKGGIVLIDEIDTGLHYSIMGDMWLLVVNAAIQNDVQVFATTHSLDCLRGLAWLCEHHPELAGKVSVQKIEPSLNEAVAFDAEDIQVAAEQAIEVPLMASNEEGPVLRVEGDDDDKHTIIHVVKRHGFERETHLPLFPNIESADSIEKLLEAVRTLVKSSTNRVVGFVLNADTSLESRWQSVSDRLLKAGFDNDQVPERLPREGFIGKSRLNSHVGVWIMPDNLSEGALEDFLLTLIDQAHPVFAHATEATDTAKTKGALFADKDRDKARLHAWLAWQEKPGCPYGTAIKAKYFGHNSELAQRFVKWFVTLYKLPSAGTAATQA